MKITCYRDQHSLDGVSILTLSTAEIPIHEVLEHRLVDVTFEERAESDRFEKVVTDIPSAPQKFRYRVGERTGGEVVEAEGMILGDGDASILSFLEHRYEPDEGTGRRLDRLICQLRRGDISRADWLRVMEQDVFGERHKRARRFSRYDPTEAQLPMFIGCRANAQPLFEQWQDSVGSCRVRSLSDTIPLAIVTSFQEKVAYESVPRWRFATMGAYDEGVGCWDGRRYRVVDQPSSLPDALRRSLDREGQVVRRSKDWFVPLPDLRPEFLVRVPYASEVADIVDAGPPPPQPGLQRPSFLLDTRRPLNLRAHSDLEVVDDPALAIAVISRQTTRGAYIPAMPPAPVNDVALSPQGQPPRYLAGCWLQ